MRNLLSVVLVGLMALGAGCGDSSTTETSAGAGGGTGGTNPGAGGSIATQGGGGDATPGAGGGGSGPEGLVACSFPACDAAPPDPGEELEWNKVGSSVTVLAGDPNHRARDIFQVPGQPQWIIGRFTYGPLGLDLTGEQVDIYVLRDCGATWELLGSVETTENGDDTTAEGIDAAGGRVFFQIPSNKALGLGRHRFHLVVRGDLTTADGFIEIVPPGTRLIATDMDGTLTTSETEQFQVLLTGAMPEANEDAAEALTLLANRGIRPLFLTARPEWLVGRSREFLEEKGFPPGVLHTSTSGIGLVGGAAADYKTADLELLTQRGLVIEYAIGNTATDADAYNNVGVAPLEHRIFFQFEDEYGGRTIDAYEELLSEFGALAPLCEP